MKDSNGLGRVPIDLDSFINGKVNTTIYGDVAKNLGIVQCIPKSTGTTLNYELIFSVVDA